MTDALLTFEKVSKAYRRGTEQVHALVDVDLEVRAGEFVVVTGPSGAGKSTLLHIGAGLDDPDRGKVAAGGRDLSALGPRERAAWRCRGLGFIFQFFNLVGNLTASENVELPLLLAGVRRREAAVRATAELEALGLRDRLGHLPSQLSGGQMQRVAIARALVSRPPLVFADEPTGNLDSASGAEVIDLLRRAASERGCGVVLVTHDTAAAGPGDVGIHVRDGRCLAAEGIM